MRKKYEKRCKKIIKRMRKELGLKKRK